MVCSELEYAMLDNPHCYAPITKHNNLFGAVGLVSNGLISSVEFVSFCITVGYDGTQSLLAPCFIAQATYILFWKETGNVHVCGATFNTPHCYLPALIKNASFDECAVL